MAGVNNYKCIEITNEKGDTLQIKIYNDGLVFKIQGMEWDVDEDDSINISDIFKEVLNNA